MTSTGRIASRGAVALVLMAAAAIPSASAAGGRAGTLDKSFGVAGRLAIAFGSADSFGQAVAHQGAKIVVVGTHEFSTTADVEVARLNPGGGPDRSFGGDGKVTVDLAGGYDQADAVAVLPDGKIMVAGTRSVGMSDRFMALRLTRNGHLDHTFGGGDGFVTAGFGNTQSSAYDLAVLSDGRFVLCGATTGSAQPVVALARYRPDGGLDPSFGNHGLVKTTFPGQTQSFCLGVAHDRNKTVIVGSVTDAITTSIAVARFGPGGAPDTSFNQDGYALIPSAQTSTDDVLVLPSGGVVAAGYAYSPTTNYDPFLVQLTAKGKPDPAFGGGDGVVTHDIGDSDIARALVRQKDGRLIVVGYTDNDMFVARYRKGGSVDPTFGNDGIQAKTWGHRTDASGAMLMGDKVVVVGSVETTRWRMAVERLFAG